MTQIKIPNQEEFLDGCKEYEKHEGRDAMYKVATFYIDHFWGKHSDMADGLGALLLTWNNAFYRYGVFDFDKLEKCIAINLQKLESFRRRDIFSLSDSDENDIRYLFSEFLESLQIDSGKLQGKKSPVAVAKALHLLAPEFFPLWDKKIAQKYECRYDKNPAESYILFCKCTKKVAEEVKKYDLATCKPLIKLIDEYNYSKYTKEWL